MPVDATEIGVMCFLCAVAVFDPVERFIKRASAKVEAEVGFAPNEFAPLHELVGADLVRFNT